jgi:predicted metal-binding membrane protein
MSESTLETVLPRDCLLVAGALAVIAALAWGYLLWLAADMDMTGFRMIPDGLGIMARLHATFRAGALRAPRTRSISATGSDGSSSPRHATCRSGRSSTSLRA